MQEILLSLAYFEDMGNSNLLLSAVLILFWIYFINYILTKTGESKEGTKEKKKYRIYELEDHPSYIDPQIN